jgi:hypothetical protein
MKTSITALLTLSTLSAVLLAHKSITLGPNGGKLFALDSTATPNAEVVVKEGQFIVGLFDKNRKPIALETQGLTITAGERSAPRKLAVTKAANSFTAPLPAGDDYWTIFQLRETPSKKPLTFRLHYQTEACPECMKPEWICECSTKESGANIPVPEALDGLFAEINQHHGELNEHFQEKEYEALDEVTKAFPVLLKALPAKSGDKSAAVQSQVDALIADLAVIADANAGRTLSTAGKNLDAFNATLADLKKNYPAKIADAKSK